MDMMKTNSNKTQTSTAKTATRRAPMLAVAIAAVTAALGATTLTIAASAAGSDSENKAETRADRGAHHLRHQKRGPINLAELSEKSAARFAAMDVDSDGRVTSEEFFAAPGLEDGAKRFGKKRHHKMRKRMRADNPERNAEMFSALDKDGNGQLSAEEFDARREVGRDFLRTGMKQKMFERLDANGDGHLSADEMNQRLERMRALDTNGDGELDRDEMRAGRDAKRNFQRS